MVYILLGSGVLSLQSLSDEPSTPVRTPVTAIPPGSASSVDVSSGAEASLPYAEPSLLSTLPLGSSDEGAPQSQSQPQTEEERLKPLPLSGKVRTRSGEEEPPPALRAKAEASLPNVDPSLGQEVNP
jgi:hypothetical protein